MAQALDTTHGDRGDGPPVPDEARSDARRPSAKVAAVPALLALAIFVGGIGVLGYPSELMLVLAGVLFAGFAVARGARFEQVVTGMGEKIKQAMPAILILFMIGVIIGSWMAAGTIPLLVSYGLRVIDPLFLYVLAFATTAVVSTFTGTSWARPGPSASPSWAWPPRWTSPSPSPPAPSSARLTVDYLDERHRSRVAGIT